MRETKQAAGRSRGIVCASALLLALAGQKAPAAEIQPPDPAVFPVPSSLEPAVDFWLDVFHRHTSNHVVLHDERYLDVVYAVLDFSRLERSPLSDMEKYRRRRDTVRKAERKYRDILQALGAGQEASPPHDARRVEALLSHLPGDRAVYREAASRLRTQTGMADQFERAIEASGRYLPAMEELFRRRGLPVELTRLPFVESMFQVNARSKVAAGGMWQIMPTTGRGLLSMGVEVDERYDPLLAAEAAASLLEEKHRALGTWPLAITAYNYGTNGMRKAVSTLGTRDLGVIVEQHRSRIFGFASRNFYAEFIAAATLYDNREHYFPGIQPLPPLGFEEFAPDRYVPVRELAAAASVELDALAELNPAVAGEVWQGHLWLPQGYRLRVPAGKASAFQAAYAALPAERKLPHQVGSRHVVRPGETLSSIARRYGSSVRAIQQANRLSSHLIRIGQTLHIPAHRGTTGRAAGAATASPGIHVVRSGDTLIGIARRYGASVAAIKAANGLSSDRIYPGQRLSIPASSAG